MKVHLVTYDAKHRVHESEIHLVGVFESFEKADKAANSVPKGCVAIIDSIELNHKTDRVLGGTI